jgi:hypothetical protein
MMNPLTYRREAELLEEKYPSRFPIPNEGRRTGFQPRFRREVLPSGCILYRLVSRLVSDGDIVSKVRRRPA